MALETKIPIQFGHDELEMERTVFEMPQCFEMYLEIELIWFLADFEQQLGSK